MREQVEQLWSYVQEAWRFRWYGLAIAWVIAVIGWTVSLQMPNEYRASAQIHVDTESLLKPLLRGLVVESDTQRQVELMTRTLLSRPNLEKLARETDLDLQVRGPEEMNQLIAELERRISLSGAGRDNLYRITYRGEEPRLARDVVQAVVNMFIEASMGRSRENTESAQAFLERKVEEYQARLEAAEQRLVEFKRQHVGEMPGDRGDYYQRLQETLEQLEQARFELETARSRAEELEKQLAGETPVFGIMGGNQPGSGGYGGTPDLDRRISGLQDRLDQLLLKYTEQHPVVATLQDRLTKLRGQREQKREQLAAAPEVSGLPRASVEQNPVHQQIRASLASARAQIATAESRVAYHEEQVKQLRGKVDTIPQVEAELRELQRDVDVARATYEELIQRQRTAEISEEASDAENRIEFRVVEPPRIPTEPVAPNRPMLVSASLGAAFVGYGAFSLLLGLVRPSFHSRAALHAALEMSVLGAIGRVNTNAVRRRRWFGMCIYTMAVGALILAYGGVLAVAAGRELPLNMASLVGLASSLGTVI